MSWINDLYVIYQKLEATGCEDIRKDLLKAQVTGCSGGEIYYLVLQQLMIIKKDKVQVYEMIKGEVENIIHCSKSMIHLN
ncbi:hypothetical protein KTO58_19600 [Chitinophaga pendula]|uniref:hypothetical protein n=1 Tax=Chitinophaga TaxID=79328 RepID=UPI000BAFB2ED|nr:MULTISPECIES: hypothetical protein [Chitinophaga]ASZ11125.1 hypothetical protein CK934_09200 [Chitinophaga sp. MD30]UCJ05878.1 hypothetical protein KTO58_19600 [Chitinophaga pendula]